MSSDPIADINTAMEAAVAAQEAGDYATALHKMESALMRISVLPNSQFDDERLEWDRPAIQSLIEYLKGRVASQTTSGQPRTNLIRPNEIRYERG
jgi:hypothetical protein